MESIESKKAARTAAGAEIAGRKAEGAEVLPKEVEEDKKLEVR
jgi:hypothetical protein